MNIWRASLSLFRAIAIRANSAIWGIKVFGSDHKGALYADDAAPPLFFFLQEPVQSLVALKAHLGSYVKISGYSVNEDKSILVGNCLSYE